METAFLRTSYLKIYKYSNIKIFYIEKIQRSRNILFGNADIHLILFTKNVVYSNNQEKIIMHK